MAAVHAPVEFKVESGGYRPIIFYQGQRISNKELLSCLQKAARQCRADIVATVLRAYRAIIQLDWNHSPGAQTRNITNLLNRLAVILCEDLCAVNDSHSQLLLKLSRQLVRCQKLARQEPKPTQAFFRGLDELCRSFTLACQWPGGLAHARDTSALKSAVLAALATNNQALEVLLEDLGLVAKLPALLRHLLAPETTTRNKGFSQKTMRLWTAGNDIACYRALYQELLWKHNEYYLPVLASLIPHRADWLAAEGLATFWQLHGKPYPLLRAEERTQPSGFLAFLYKFGRDQHTSRGPRKLCDATAQFLYQGITHASEPFVLRLPPRYLADYFRCKLLLSSTEPTQKKEKKTLADSSNKEKPALRACLQSARPDWSWIGPAKVACGNKPSSAIVRDKQGLQFFVKGPLAGSAAAEFQLSVELVKQQLWPDYSPLRFDASGLFLWQSALGSDRYEPTSGGLAVSPSVRSVQLSDLLVPELCLQVLLRLLLRFVLEASDSHLRNLLLDERARVVLSVDEMTRTERPLPSHDKLPELRWLFTKQANLRVLEALRACWKTKCASVVEFLQAIPVKEARRDELLRLIGALQTTSPKRKRRAD